MEKKPGPHGTTPEQREEAKQRGPMLNQTGLTGNPVSNQTSKPGNQAQYEPGQPVRESNVSEGHHDNKGRQGAPV